jgi:hypothetical protein
LIGNSGGWGKLQYGSGLKLTKPGIYSCILKPECFHSGYAKQFVTAGEIIAGPGSSPPWISELPQFIQVYIKKTR